MNDCVCNLCGKVFKDNYCNRSYCPTCKKEWEKMSTKTKTLVRRCGVSILDVLEKLGSECEICGYTHVLDIHHKDEDKLNNNLSNIIMLCPNCHMLVHRKRFTLKEIRILNKEIR